MPNPLHFPQKDVPTKEVRWTGLRVEQRWLAFLALNPREVKYTQSGLRQGNSTYSLVTPTLPQFLHLKDKPQNCPWGCRSL